MTISICKNSYKLSSFDQTQNKCPRPVLGVKLTPRKEVDSYGPLGGHPSVRLNSCVCSPLGVNEGVSINPLALHFSDYSFGVHQPVNQADRHLLADAMTSDFSVALQCLLKRTIGFSLQIKLGALIRLGASQPSFDTSALNGVLCVSCQSH
jgi:hypothetical protein